MNILVKIVIAVFILISNFSLVPEFLTFPYLVSNGLSPYSEVVDQHMPGLVLSNPNLYDLGFSDSNSYKKLYLLIVIFQMSIIGIFCKRLLAINSVVPLIFFGLLHLSNYGGSVWFETFLPVFTIPALYFLIKGRYYISGLLIGISFLFKQNSVLLLLPSIGYLFYLRKAKAVALLLVGSAIPVLFFIADLIYKDVFLEFINWAVIFNFKTYATSAFIYPNMRDLVLILLMSTLSIFTFIFSNNKIIKIVVLWFLFTIPGLFIRYNSYQFQASIPFISLYIIEFLNIKKIRYLNRIIFIIIIFLVLLNILTTKKHNYNTNEIVEISGIVSEVTNDGDEIFLFGAQPHIYQLSNTIPAGRFFLYSLPWYYFEAENKQLEELVAHPPKYILFDSNSEIDGVNIRNTGAKVMNFIEKNYGVKKVHKNYVLYEIIN